MLPLGAAKDKHFSFFQRSCQLGLKALKKTFCSTLNSRIGELVVSFLMSRTGYKRLSLPYRVSRLRISRDHGQTAWPSVRLSTIFSRNLSTFKRLIPKTGDRTTNLHSRPESK